MRAFAALYEAIDRTTSTNAKVDAMAAWFREAAPEDAAWALWFLMGFRLTRILPTKDLVEEALAVSGLPGWLFGESHAAVGDLAETVALLVEDPDAVSEDLPLHAWIDRVRTLPTLDPPARRAALSAWWASLRGTELFLLNKILTGAFRVGVSHTLVVRALAQASDVPPDVLAHRLMGTWTPSGEGFRALVAPGGTAEDLARPYPFMLASPLEGGPAALGDPADWLVEWKWDGIRAQIVRRAGTLCVWSRGEELIADRFPELETAAAALPEGTVLDGEILAWSGDRPLAFADLQTRIGRKKLDPAVLAAAPASFLAFDLLEQDGVDLRGLPLAERRGRLEALRRPPGIRVSERVVGDWEALAALRDESRARGVEGYVLKRLASTYTPGRHKGDWWKWKVDPFTLDAVLVYAQPGSGRRAGLHTDMTFAVWEGDTLLPVAKAYSGLSNAELEDLDRWIRRHTRERHGPVRAVEPELVFEIAFEGIAPSNRHKSGVAVRFPRIVRRRLDKAPRDADTLERVKALLKVGG